MTGKRSSGDPANSAKASGVVKTPDPDAPAAATKASVHEAIGKLIGDDAEQERGAADKEATGILPGKPNKTRSLK